MINPIKYCDGALKVNNCDLKINRELHSTNSHYEPSLLSKPCHQTTMVTCIAIIHSDSAIDLKRTLFNQYQ